MTREPDPSVLRAAYGRDASPAAREAALAQLRPSEVSKPSETRDATGTERPRNQRVVWVVAACTALLFGLGIGVAVSQPTEPHGSILGGTVDSLDDGVTYDSASIAYLGSFRDSDFWAATKSSGESTCLIVESTPGSMIPSASSCAPTSVAITTPISFGSSEVGPTDATNLVTFELRISTEGSQSLTISNSRLEDSSNSLP